MKRITLKTNPVVATVFENYPESVREKLLNLRRLVIETAEEVETVIQLEETLKWGEPSYLTKGGSTIRMDWKEKTPEQYAMYFQCTSNLVPTFKLAYADKFQFEGTRAIIFPMNAALPEEELKNCIRLGLTYHKVKNLPLLGL